MDNNYRDLLRDYSGFWLIESLSAPDKSCKFDSTLLMKHYPIYVISSIILYTDNY